MSVSVACVGRGKRSAPHGRACIANSPANPPAASRPPPLTRGAVRCGLRPYRTLRSLILKYPKQGWSRIQLDQVFDRRNLFAQLVAQLLRLLHQRGFVVAGLVRVADTQCAYGLAGCILKRQLDAEPFALAVDTRDRLAGLDHLEIVRVRLLAVPAEGGGENDVVLALRWAYMERETQQLRMPGGRRVDQFLRMRLGRRERVQGIGIHQIRDIENPLRECIANLLRLL